MPDYRIEGQPAILVRWATMWHFARNSPRHRGWTWCGREIPYRATKRGADTAETIDPRMLCDTCKGAL